MACELGQDPRLQVPRRPLRPEAVSGPPLQRPVVRFGRSGRLRGLAGARVRAGPEGTRAGAGVRVANAGEAGGQTERAAYWAVFRGERQVPARNLRLDRSQESLGAGPAAGRVCGRPRAGGKWPVAEREPSAARIQRPAAPAPSPALPGPAPHPLQPFPAAPAGAVPSPATWCSLRVSLLGVRTPTR